MKVKCLTLALVAGLACSTATMADPGQAGGSSVRNATAEVGAPIALPKGHIPGRATYNMATGEWRIDSVPSQAASDVNVRGPLPPLVIWDSTGESGFYTNRLNPANVALGDPLAETFDWGSTCGDPLVDIHTVNQFIFAYATDEPDVAGLQVSVTLYWNFDPGCPAGPFGPGGFGCLAADGVIFDIPGIPGSLTSPAIEGWIITIDLTGFEEMLPAGQFGYSLSEWVGFTLANAGPIISLDDQLAAPGAEDAFDFYAGLNQQGYFGSFFFGGAPFAQFYFQLAAQVACPAPTMGGCCDNVLQTCMLSLPENCVGVDQTFLGIGNGCGVDVCVPAPANDDCATAIAISGFGQVGPYDNRGANDSGPGGDCVLFGNGDTAHDVWYSWIAPCTGNVELTSCSLNASDDKVVVYQGSNCADLSVVVGCDDDGCNVAFGPVTTTWAATQGQAYLIRMGVFPGQAGNAAGFFELVNVDSCTPVASCPADWNINTQVEVVDIFAFLTDWFNNVPAAQNFGGTPGVPAIFAFLTVWFATGVGPCP